MNEQAAMMNQQKQQPQLLNMNQNLMGMNLMNPHQQQPQIVAMNRSYGMWPPPPPQQFQNPMKPPQFQNPGSMNPPASSFNKSLGPRGNWKGKKVNNPNDKRRKDQQQQKSLMVASGPGVVNMISGIVGGGTGNQVFNSYQPPTLNDLQQQNRLKTRKFFSKRKFNKNNNMNMGGHMNNSYNSRSAPHAPRNTSSYLIRAKKSGGIASLVSPCPVTPAVLQTPVFSPSGEVVVDMAKEEWGVDGYGSMKGLIRLRSPGHELETNEDEEEDERSSSDSDVEEHVEVEKRLDHDLSRFEMIGNPNNSSVGGMEYHNVLESRVDDQDAHIAQLEEENLILKERLFLMEREFGDLRRRMLCLERRDGRGEEINEEVVDNDSENDSESHDEEAHSMEDNNEDFSEDNVQGVECFEAGATKDFISDTEEKLENENVSSVEGKEGNTCGELIEPSKNESSTSVVEHTEGKNNNDNGPMDAEVKAEDNVDVGGDFSMQDVEVAKEMVVEKNSANKNAMEVNESSKKSIE